MKYELKPLKASHLTNSEVAELASRTIADFGSLPPGDPRTDDSIAQTYIQGLIQRSLSYDKAINRIQKDVNTQPVTESDKDRGNAASSFFKSVRVGLTSDVPAEMNAAQRLMIVVDAYRGVARQNYEKETKDLDTMVTQLESPTYAPSVAALNLQRYVARIKTTNNSFKALFTTRITTSALTESFDTNNLRIDLLDYYTEYTRYMLAMANATNDNFFVQQLSFINAARKYYHDNIISRSKEPVSVVDPDITGVGTN
jgi:hypothetical protein